MKRIVTITLATLACAALGLAIAYGPRFIHLADIGAGYVAKQTCSCIHVAGRDVAGCRADMPDDMDRIQATILEDGRRGVRARVLGIERLALYSPGAGCALQP
jgi:hypothetical protein